MHKLVCIQDDTVMTMQLQYSLVMLSATELKKPISQQEPKGPSFALVTDEPWDTLKAQLLTKIDSALKPNTITFANYHLKYFIPHMLSKPGLDLESEEDYDGLVDHSHNIKLNSPTISVNGDKENENENIVQKLQENDRKLEVVLTCHDDIKNMSRV